MKISVERIMFQMNRVSDVLLLRRMTIQLKHPKKDICIGTVPMFTA